MLTRATQATQFIEECESIWDGDATDLRRAGMSDANRVAREIYNAKPGAQVRGDDQDGVEYVFPDGSVAFVGANGGEVRDGSNQQ